MEKYWGLIFLFSGRRRHTSSKRDWSSDVCSSDLGSALPAQPVLVGGGGRQQHHRARAEQGEQTPGAGPEGPDGHDPSASLRAWPRNWRNQIGRASCRGRVRNPREVGYGLQNDKEL